MFKRPWHFNRHLAGAFLAAAFVIAVAIAAFAQNNPYSPASPGGYHITVNTLLPPTLSSCGTSPSVVGADIFGVITTGTGTPSACTMTFNQPWNKAPICQLSWQTGPLASMSWTVSTTAITITQTATSSTQIGYDCRGQAGG